MQQTSEETFVETEGLQHEKNVQGKVKRYGKYTVKSTFEQSAMDKELKQCDVQIRHLEKKIEKLNYEESKVYQGYVTGEVSRENFRRMQEKSADAVMRLRGQISNEEANRHRYKRFFGKKLQWLRAIYHFQSEPCLDSNMLEHLVHSIYLYPDNRLEINLNFKDEYAERMKEEA